MGGRKTIFKQLGYGTQVFADVQEKLLVAFANVLQPRFIVVGHFKSMLGAPAAAGRQHVALPAPTGQGALLGNAEAGLSGAFRQNRQGFGEDIPQPVFWIDAMVAGIDVAIVFDHQRPAALFGMDADRRGVADPGIECPFEVHDEEFAHIVTHPLFINGDEKIAVGLAIHRPGRDPDLIFFLV